MIRADLTQAVAIPSPRNGLQPERLWTSSCKFRGNGKWKASSHTAWTASGSRRPTGRLGEHLWLASNERQRPCGQPGATLWRAARDRGRFQAPARGCDSANGPLTDINLPLVEQRAQRLARETAARCRTAQRFHRGTRRAGRPNHESIDRLRDCLAAVGGLHLFLAGPCPPFEHPDRPQRITVIERPAAVLLEQGANPPRVEDAVVTVAFESKTSSRNRCANRPRIQSPTGAVKPRFGSDATSRGQPRGGELLEQMLGTQVRHLRRLRYAKRESTTRRSSSGQRTSRLCTMLMRSTFTSTSFGR